MALAAETPSRIWRRIEEGEARGAELPSLPSLPGFDGSSGDGDAESLPSKSLSMDLEVSLPAINSNFVTSRRPQTKPLVISKVNHRSDPQPLKPTLMRPVATRPSDPFDKAPEDDSPVLFGAMMRSGGSDRRRTSTSSSLRTSTPQSKGLVNSGRAGIAPEDSFLKNLASGSRSPSPILPPLPNTTFDIGSKIDDGTNCSRDLDISKSFQKSLSMSDFKSITIRKPPDATHPPELSRSVSSLSSSGSSHNQNHTPSDTEDATLQQGKIIQRYSEEPSHSTRDSMHDEQHDANGNSYSQEKETMGTAISSREPTFSSEAAEDTEATPMPAQRSVRFTPAPSAPAMIATPLSYQQTPRAGLESVAEEVEEDLLTTPFPRRKSFLLSIVNSTTRPRLKLPTPHPRAMAAPVDSSGFMTPGPAFSQRSTARHGRFSHPLQQVTNFRSSPGYVESTTDNDESSVEGAGAASVISTASSHDLTVHHRANASFDPVTGPQGVGRFNAGKLNTYLHGLNRRLQEENEQLVDRVRSQQTEIEYLQARTHHLSGVVEDDKAEEWGLEKESLERKITDLHEALEKREQELDKEREGRLEDKQRWKDRMIEVEDGVGEVVSGLQEKLAKAETRAQIFEKTESQLRETQRELESAQSQLRLAKARDLADASKSEEGSATSSSHDSRIFVEMDERIRQLERQLREKEVELISSREHALDVGKELTLSKTSNRNLESDLRVARESVANLQEELRDNRRERSDESERARKAQEMASKLKSDLSLANDKRQNYEKLLAETSERLQQTEKDLDAANEQVALSEDDLNKLRTTNKELEDALEESDQKMLADSKELTQLRTKLVHLEKELEGARSFNRTNSDSKSIHAVDIGNLEGELEDANREIGRLTALLNQSPARKAIERARESRIEALEKENADLFSQLRMAREREPPNYDAAKLDSLRFDTPRRHASMGGLSPMHKQLINMSLRTPKTPGEPLKNASWLLNLTGDVTAADLVEELHRLQKELDIANESIDDKLDKLGEAGFGVVELTKALEEAHRRIAKLEALVTQYEEYDARQNSVCLKCEEKVSNGESEPTSSVQMRLTLVTAELESLRKRHEEAIATTSGEKAILRDAATRLNSEIRRAKEELRIAQKRGQTAEKSKAELERELTSAKRAIIDLERNLHSERARLHGLSSDNIQALKQKERILEKLKDTERRMDDTKDRLFQLKESNIRLEAQLGVEQRATHIEERLVDNNRTIEGLRHERTLLADKHFELQHHLSEASKNASDLAARYANLQSSYEGRRRQLDMQSKELEDLRTAFSSQASKLQKIQSGARHDRPNPEAQNLAARLEAEIKRISQEADRFGRDLIELRDERDYLIERHRQELEHHERMGKQNKAELQLLHDQVRSLRHNAMLEAEMTIDSTTEALKAKHNKECKGLFVQIRYLKAKFTREAALRDGLSYQKSYLLILLQQHEKSERRILATIAQLDPSDTPPSKPARKSLRSVVHAVVFIQRTKQACDEWREEKQARLAVTEALESVRRNRILST